MKILFCPAHYVLTKDKGSELSWAYNIVNLIGEKYPESLAITGFGKQQDVSIPIQRLQPHKKSIDLSFLNSLIFTFKYGFAGFDQTQSDNFDIHHHILPFTIDRTFNISFLLRKNIVKIIGPIQSPLPYYSDNIHDDGHTLPRGISITTIIISFFSKILSPVLYFLSLKTLLSADAIVVINEHTRRLVAQRGVPEKKIHIIPPGIHLKKYTHNNHIESKGLVLISIGTLMKRKGFVNVLSDFAHAVHTDGLDIRLIIAGDGPQKEKLMRLINKLKIQDKVRLLGRVPYNKMESIYSSGDIFISGSQAESWGQMYLEAMASGLPIITIDNIGAQSILVKNKTALIVPPKRNHGIADAIKKLVIDRNLRKSMGGKARLEAEKYDWKTKILPQYINLYSSLFHEKK